MNEHVGEQLGLMVSLAFGRLGIANSGINSPTSLLQRPPCLKMHFSCIKVVSRLPMGSPCPILPIPPPPTRWHVHQPQELSAGDIRCYGNRSQPGTRRGLRREQVGPRSLEFSRRSSQTVCTCVFKPSPGLQEGGSMGGGILRRGF